MRARLTGPCVFGLLAPVVRGDGRARDRLKRARASGAGHDGAFAGGPGLRGGQSVFSPALKRGTQEADWRGGSGEEGEERLLATGAPRKFKRPLRNCAIFKGGPVSGSRIPRGGPALARPGQPTGPPPIHW